MKILSKRIICISLFLSLGGFVQAQNTATPATPATGNNSLSRQYQELKETANNYQEYKVVRETRLDAFWKNVQDSLAARQREEVAARQQIQEQQQEIARLSQEIKERAEAVAASEYDKEHISVLGMDLRKETYITINWVVIGLLVLILAVVIYNHSNSKRFAERKRSEYEMLEQEFQDHKNRSRERETKLMRELQTERNAVEELNQQLMAAQRGKPGV